MDILDALKWRYATKRMNGQKVEQEKLDMILEALQLSASSYGLQPYKVLVISDEALRNKLLPAAYNQPQVVESSHLLVFTAWTAITDELIESFLQDVAKKRNISREALAGYHSALTQLAANLKTPEAQHNWAAKQSYIALGTALAAAAELKVDASPMEGFNAQQFNEILGLKEKGLSAVSLMAIGYRSPADTTVSLPKVRKDNAVLFQHI
jgi:nitroreductase/dihydropteridine reductase